MLIRSPVERSTCTTQKFITLSLLDSIGPSSTSKIGMSSDVGWEYAIMERVGTFLARLTLAFAVSGADRAQKY